MSLKIQYLDIPKSPVANCCRRKTAHWCKKGMLLGRPRSGSNKQQHKPVWFHLLHPRSNTEKALWVNNLSGSLIQAKCKAGSSSSLNTTGEVFVKCEPPTTALRKVCHGFRVRDETDYLWKEDVEEGRSVLSGKEKQQNEETTYSFSWPRR